MRLLHGTDEAELGTIQEHGCNSAIDPVAISAHAPAEDCGTLGEASLTFKHRPKAQSLNSTSPIPSSSSKMKG